MKRPRLIRALVLAAAAVLLPGWAVVTHALNIGATVMPEGNCRFDNAGPTALAFGTIDPSSTVEKTATASIGYRCTAGTPAVTWFVTSDSGQFGTGPGAPRMRHTTDTTRFVRYSLSFPASGTSSTNTTLDVVVSGTIAVADFRDAAAGSYADSIVLTITP